MTIAQIIENARNAESVDYDQLIMELMGSDEMSDYQAQVDSLTEENQKLLHTDAERSRELQETKKLNFTLGRQISRQPEKSLEELLNDIL